MAKWTDYPTKTTPVDTDDIMIYDATGKANKRVLFSGLWNWIVDKMTNAVINNLQTNNKTILGALNELNSNTQITYQSLEFSAGIIRRFGRICGVLINNGDFTSDGHANFTIPKKFRPAISTDYVDAYSKVRFSINTDGTIDQRNTPYSTGPVRGYFTYISEE